MSITEYEEFEDIELDEITKQILINIGLGIGITNK